jgi:hypothetical protein
MRTRVRRSYYVRHASRDAWANRPSLILLCGPRPPRTPHALTEPQDAPQSRATENGDYTALDGSKGIVSPIWSKNNKKNR